MPGLRQEPSSVPKRGNNIMRTIYFFGLMTMLLLSDSFFILTASAEIKSITVTVDGLACPFCAYGIEKKTKRLNGVKEIEIHLNTGIVILKCTEDKSPALADVRTAVKDAGFTPRSIKIIAHGTIIEDEVNGLLFKFNELQQPFSLINLEGNVEEKVQNLLGTNIRVELTGEVFKRDRDNWVVSPKMVEEISP